MSVFTNAATSSPEERAQYVAALLELLGNQNAFDVLRVMGAALDDVLGACSPGDIRRTEAAEKWSILQVLQHLADSELVWGFRLRMVLAQDRPALTGYDQDLWAARLRYHEGDPRDAVARFGILRQSNLALLERASDDDLQRTGVHAERGEETLAHMVRLYAGHDLLHLRQIARIRQTLAISRPVPAGQQAMVGQD
jgi:hypothetical protein